MAVSASLYFCNFLGFLLQIGPCIILCMVPVSVYSCRYSYRRILAGLLFLGVVFSAAAPFLFYTQFFGLLQQQINLTVNSYMLVAILVCSVIYCRLIRDELANKLFVIFTVILYASTVYMVVSAITPLFTDNDFYHGYSPRGIFWYAIFSAILFPVVFLIEKKWLREYLSEIAGSHIIRVFRWLAVLTVIYIFMMYYYTAHYELSSLVCVSFILTALILWTFYAVLMRESVRQRRDAVDLREAQIRELRYENAMGDMETSRRMRHDLHHLLNGLSRIAEQGDIDGIKSFLSDAVGAVSRSENRIFCEDTFLNSLLQYYVEQAEREGIACNVSADCGELKLSQADLTVVFGNIMENAIRACREVEEDARITLRIGRNRGMFLMQVTNSCSAVRASGRHDLNRGFLPAEAFASTRRGGGLGLRSIEVIAEKHGGEAKFRYDMSAKEFTARIFMRPDAE